jgi:hypothetical protein
LITRLGLLGDEAFGAGADPAADEPLPDELQAPSATVNRTAAAAARHRAATGRRLAWTAGSGADGLSMEGF